VTLLFIIGEIYVVVTLPFQIDENRVNVVINFITRISFVRLFNFLLQNRSLENPSELTFVKELLCMKRR
jgi:hypothetical protein